MSRIGGRGIGPKSFFGLDQRLGGSKNCGARSKKRNARVSAGDGAWKTGENRQENGASMVQFGAQMPRSGEPAARPFRCQAGCLESSISGQRCQPAGSTGYAPSGTEVKCHYILPH